MADMTTPLPLHLVHAAHAIGGDMLALVQEAHRLGYALGRLDGAEECRARIANACVDLVVQLETRRDRMTEERRADLERLFAWSGPSPVVAAYFGAAIDVLTRTLERLRVLDISSRE